MSTLLFASKHEFPPYSRGGGEMCAIELLDLLHKRTAFDVSILGATDSVVEKETGVISGVEITHVPPSSFTDRLRHRIETAQPSALFTSLEGTGHVAQIGDEYDIALGLLIVDRGDVFDGLSCFTQAPVVVVISKYLRRLVLEHFGYDAVRFPPCVDGPTAGEEDALNRLERRTVGLVNMNRIKGGRMFCEMSTRFPDFRFVATRGWTYPGIAPPVRCDHNLVDLVDWMPDVTSFYRQISVLLVPSLCPEGYGRVARESLLHGVPVIASDRGALQESACQTGDFLNPTDPNAWELAIDKLLNRKARYREQSVIGMRRARRQCARDQEVRVDAIDTIATQFRAA